MIFTVAAHIRHRRVKIEAHVFVADSLCAHAGACVAARGWVTRARVTSASNPDFRVLGPLEVVRDGEPVALGGRNPRALLALLVLRRGQTVSVDELMDVL